VRIARHGRPRYAGSLVGRRTTKIAKCALLRVLPTDLITTHRAKGRRVTQPRSGRPAQVHPPQVWSGTGSTLGGVRLTEFWDRMNAQFGDVYAQSVAKDFVFDKLGGRTVERALADGADAKAIWRAVCDTFKVPENMR
jgi:Protein of unknown function (DUF3046)